MNEKEIAEIRRRFRAEKSNITHIRGCYVNQQKEIISEFNQSLSIMPEDETEKFLGILKKTLSGTLDKNLIDISFSNQQVVDSDEHRLLMAVRSSSLSDENAVHTLFDKIIQATTMDENYLILLACDTYDIPYRAKDGGGLPDASSDVFSYVLCSICPVKMTKPALGYFATENTFHSCESDWIVAAPESGFLFPSFDDRSTNIYNALYYSRNAADNHPELIDALFNCEAPMPATEQKETFTSILCGTLENDCNFDTVQTLHGHLQEMMEEHKTNKEEEPLVVSKQQVRRLLETGGVAEEHIEAFSKEFDEQFGDEMRLNPQLIVNPKQIEVVTPDVKIQINAERDDLVETRVIDGIKYILIRAEEGVELNGVPVRIR